MKISLLTLVFLGFIISFSTAQTVPFPETEVTDNTAPTGEVLDSVFANLDLSGITTGLPYHRRIKTQDFIAFFRHFTL